MESESKPVVFFVNSTGSSGYQAQSDRTRRRIRQQAMREIGKQRRKPARNPKFDLAPEFSAEATRPSSTPSSLRTIHVQHYSQHLERQHPLLLAKPFGDQHPFAIMYNSWGMDPFAVYAFGFALKGQSSPARESISVPLFEVMSRRAMAHSKLIYRRGFLVSICIWSSRILPSHAHWSGNPSSIAFTAKRKEHGDYLDTVLYCSRLH
jgi:hypothetical protein